MSNGNKKLIVHVEALQLDLEGLLKLLGGTEEDRSKFWQILKGITTPRISALVEANLAAASSQVQATAKIVGALKTGAKELST
jgi:hypothetical protein